MDIFPAHIRPAQDDCLLHDEVQSVSEHCRAASAYAEEVLSPIGLGQTAALAGLLHDCGKYTTAFSEYLWASYRGEDVRRGSVNHTFAGVQYLLQHFHQGTSAQQKLTCELLAYAVGAHHGLFDLIKDSEEYAFPHRQMARGIGCEEAIGNFLDQCANAQELEHRMANSIQEVEQIISCMSQYSENDPVHFGFYLGLLSRLILSAVIEGDRKDTATFMHRLSFPVFPKNRTDLWEECLQYMEKKLGNFPCVTPIQKARCQISDLCRDKASSPGGIWRLNVPTGGGKTLASLRYALAHAAAHGKQRIFFVIPLLSIIDQNSQVIRSFLPRQDILLEHHSNVIRSDDGNNDQLDPWELLADNWSAPMVLTTMVQFLNTLFSGKTTAIRRFQSLCNSVIVFDEVQTVPPKMLSLFNLAISFLASCCGTTVVLCSATQPSLAQAAHPICGKIRELVPYDAALWAPFHRTHMESTAARPLAEIPEFIQQLLREHRSVLVVCNLKQQAQVLYQALAGKVPHIFHLSAAMCMAHRREMLAQLSATLEKNSGVLCISTQVIEAGVDISFSCVVRLLAGMDSAVQAAGRCNRNGESDTPAPVYLLRCSDENLSMLQEMQEAQDAAEELLCEFQQHRSQFQNSLTSDSSIAYYYRCLYRHMPLGAQDFPIAGGNNLLDLLSLNQKNAQLQSPPQYFLHQNFLTAGQSFKVFDENTSDVLVPYGDKGRELMADLCSERAKNDFSFVQKTLERAKPYTISLFQYQFNKLSQEHALHYIFEDQVPVLCEDYYDPTIGLLMDPWANQSSEVNPCNIQML